MTDKHGQMLQMGLEEVPNAFFGPCLQFKLPFKLSQRLVGRDNKVLLDGIRAIDLFGRALLLVQSADICNEESGFLNGFLDRIPNGILGVMECDGQPTVRLQDTVEFA